MPDIERIEKWEEVIKKKFRKATDEAQDNPTSENFTYCDFLFAHDIEDGPPDIANNEAYLKHLKDKCPKCLQQKIRSKRYD